jgi:TolB-like protein
MNKTGVLWGLVLALLLTFPAAPRAEYKKTKIAVLDFELKGEGFQTEDLGAIVAEWFITALVKEGRFDVIERSLLNKILDEQKLGLSGVVDESTATEIGKLLGAKVIISGSVLRLTQSLEINARIIDVETASIIAAENVSSSTAERLQDLVIQMAAKIMKHFPLEGYVVSRGKNTNLVTIDLGRLAGVKTGMEFIVFKEGKLIKHPKTGEVLDVERINLGRLVITDVREKIADAEILEETATGAISFGQRVQSRAALTAMAETGQDRPAAPAPEARSDHRGVTPDDVVQLLRSFNYDDKTRGAKYLVRYYNTDPQLLKVAEEELLANYQLKERSRDFAEAMAWLCNALGRSGNAQYKETLAEVAQNANNRKLKSYAKKNLKQFK